MRRGNWLKGLSREPSARDLTRMKILAHAAGFEIKTKSDALRIIHLADVFRGILRLSHNLSREEAAENRQRELSEKRAARFGE
jgi:hypothetical protein